MTNHSSTEFDGPRNRVDGALLELRLNDICAGLVEAIDREVEKLRREGSPIYVMQDGKIVDLQTYDASNDPAPKP